MLRALRWAAAGAAAAAVTTAAPPARARAIVNAEPKPRTVARRAEGDLRSIFEHSPVGDTGMS